MDEEVEQIKIFNKKTIVCLIILCLLLLLSFVFYKENKLFTISAKQYIFQLFIYIISVIILNIVFRKTKDKTKFFELFSTLIYITNVLGIVLFVNVFLVSTAKVDGSSMQPNFENNDTLIVWHGFYKINKDDVVIIDCKNLSVNAELVIKRVVATSNDKIEYKENSLFVNGYFVEQMSYNEYTNILTNFDENKTYEYIPEDFYIVLGDNRNNSTDSRTVGLVHKDEIVGKSIFRILPLSSLGFPN